MASSGTTLILRFDFSKFRDPNTDLADLARNLFQQYGPDCAAVLNSNGTCKSIQDCMTAKPAAAAAAVSPTLLKRPSLPPMLPDQDQDHPNKKKCVIAHIDLSGDTSSSEEEDTDESSEEQEEQCPHCGDPVDVWITCTESEKKATGFTNYEKLCSQCARDCWDVVGECFLCHNFCGLVSDPKCKDRLEDLPPQEGDSTQLDEPLAVCPECYRHHKKQHRKRAKNYTKKDLGLWETHLPEYTLKPCEHCSEHTLAIQCNRLKQRIACSQCGETYE